VRRGLAGCHSALLAFVVLAKAPPFLLSRVRRGALEDLLAVLLFLLVFTLGMRLGALLSALRAEVVQVVGIGIVVDGHVVDVVVYDAHMHALVGTVE
jgi:hypothetical protein